MHFFKLTVVVLLNALLIFGAPLYAQNQGFGSGEAGAYPQYRVEVLAFAYNAFDPGEEIFPDEHFAVQMDTRPPRFLVTAPPDSVIDPLQIVMPRDASLDDSPESDDDGVAMPGQQDLRAEVGFPDELVLRDEIVGPPEPVQTVDDEPPPDGETSDAPEGALETLDALVTAGDMALQSDAVAVPASNEPMIRSAFGQRLLSSLQRLDDPARLPIVFEPGALDEPADFVPLAPPLVESTPEIATEETARPAIKPRSPFRPLRADELELGGALRNLTRAGDFTPLAHGGWIQAAYPQDEAIEFDVSLLGAVNPVGTMKLHLSRFLHVTLDLVYRAPFDPRAVPAPTDDSALTGVTLPSRYALRIQHRLRSGEVNYIDHPAFGVLVVVTPQPVELEDDGEPLGPPRGPAA